MGPEVKELEDKLQQLVDLAFEKGLLAAIEAAREAKDPYLLDALHDMLVDRRIDWALLGRILVTL